MNPSQYWLKLVNKNLTAKKLPFDAAWRLTGREHPDAATLMSAFGVTRAQVNFFNSRRENQPAAEELSEFQRNVLGSKAKQFANSQAGGAARPPQFVKILTIGDRLAENKQFANEDPVPVGHAKMYRLFWLPSTITQEQWQAAWVMYGCVAEEVTADVEAGKYLWVFDFNRRDGRRRDFRFWVGELADRPAAQALQLENVINEILPPRRANYPTGEIQHRFLISRSKWMQLRHWMNLPAGSAPREALAAWLKSQWAGGKAK